MKMLNATRAYFRPILHAIFTHVALKNYWKTFIFVPFESKFAPFHNILPCSHNASCMPSMPGICPGNLKIIEVEHNPNASLGSLYLQNCHQSFRSFILFLSFYRYSFTSYLWSDITFRKWIFVGIKFRNIWPISQKLVSTKTIGKLLIREI